MWGYAVSWFGWNNPQFAGCFSRKACKGVALSVSVMVAVAALVPVVATNMAAAMVTVINGGNYLGRRGDCAVQHPGSLISTRGRPMACTQPSAQEGTMFPVPLASAQSPQHLPVQWPMSVVATLAY